MFVSRPAVRIQGLYVLQTTNSPQGRRPRVEIDHAPGGGEQLLSVEPPGHDESDGDDGHDESDGDDGFISESEPVSSQLRREYATDQITRAWGKRT